MRPRKPLGPVGKAVTAIATAILLALALMFSLVLLVLLVSAGLLTWAYLRWKWRNTPRRGGDKGNVFEGEAEVILAEDGKTAPMLRREPAVAPVPRD